MLYGSGDLYATGFKKNNNCDGDNINLRFKSLALVRLVRQTSGVEILFLFFFLGFTRF